MLCRDNWWLLAFFRQPPIIRDELKTRMGFSEASIRGLRPPFGSGRPHSRDLAAYRNRQFTQIIFHKLNRRMLTLDTSDSEYRSNISDTIKKEPQLTNWQSRFLMNDYYPLYAIVYTRR